MLTLTSKLRDLLLENSFIYDVYSRIVGRKPAEKKFATDFIKAKKNEKILDIGCGTGAMLQYMKPLYYEGFDINKNYIEKAKRTFKNQGNFFNVSFENYKVKKNFFDKAVSCGVLHHLNDKDSTKLLKTAYKSLKPGGSLFTIDGCYTENQSFIEYALLKADRGKFVRTTEQYLGLATEIFSSIDYKIIKGLLRIPYTVIIMKFTK